MTTRVILTYAAMADPGRRSVEAFELSGDGYRPAGRLEGDAARALPPFPDLALDPR